MASMLEAIEGLVAWRGSAQDASATGQTRQALARAVPGRSFPIRESSAALPQASQRHTQRHPHNSLYEQRRPQMSISAPASAQNPTVHVIDPDAGASNASI